MSSNMNSIVTNETISSNDSLASLYIPRVYGNIPHTFIQETFEGLDLGIVSHIQTVKREGNAYMAFVHFKSWNVQNPAAVNLAKKVNDPNAQARIVYDDPWYWILLPNTSAATTSSSSSDTTPSSYPKIPVGICAQEWEQMEKTRIKREKEQKKMKEDAFIAASTMNQDEEFEILKLMVEDLQLRLRDSDKKQFILQQEVFNLRTVLLTSESHVDKANDIPVPSVSPPMPKLVRQRAISTDDIPVSHPPLVRQNATIVDALDTDDLPVPPIPSTMIGGFGPVMRQPEPSIRLPDVYPTTAPSLPPSPFIVEPSHFHSSASVPEILNALENALMDHSVTITKFNEDKCKFNCHCYSSSGEVTFVVNVFNTPEGNLVEFQKRSGDAGWFCRVYDSIAHKLISLIDYSVPKSSQSYHQTKLPRVAASKSASHPISFDNYMRSTIMKHINDEDNFLPPRSRSSDVEASWWPSEEEIQAYHEDRINRRMEEAEIETVKVDGMGLVYPNADSGFWCDP